MNKKVLVEVPELRSELEDEFRAILWGSDLTEKLPAPGGNGYSVAEDRIYEHNREVSKLCFEYFKHFTTITTAAALLELTLYQYFQLSRRWQP